MSYKIDLHTHSILSHDGGIGTTEYQKILTSKTLDYIAVTDHNFLGYAKELRQYLGDHVIIGEEIKTTSGEIVGLFLTDQIEPKLSLKTTVKMIHAQGGLVYVPHPFNTNKAGLNLESLLSIINEIDIVEVYNARSLMKEFNVKAQSFADKYHLPGAASSDAHSKFGIGNSFSLVEEPVTSKNLVKQLQKAQLTEQRANLREFLAPTINRLNKGLKLIPDK